MDTAPLADTVDAPKTVTAAFLQQQASYALTTIRCICVQTGQACKEEAVVQPKKTALRHAATSHAKTQKSRNVHPSMLPTCILFNSSAQSTSIWMGLSQEIG
jgi:hypothetical protein